MILSITRFGTAICMHHTVLDPFAGDEAGTAKHLRDRELPRALLPFLMSENDFEACEALLKADRGSPLGQNEEGRPRPSNHAKEAR